MGINLMRDLGFDESSIEVAKAREAADVYDRLIDALVAGREEIGLKQKDLAARMKTSQSAVSDFENRNSDARFSTVLRYAQAIGAEITMDVSLPRTAMHSTKPDWVTLNVESAIFQAPQRSKAGHGMWKHVVEREVVQLPLNDRQRVAA